MPFYDLFCMSCDKEFKISASMSDKDEGRIACPDCGSHDLKTLFKSAPAYIKSKKSECPNRHTGCMGCSHAG
jgi:putative FmdB family regulatory protein